MKCRICAKRSGYVRQRTEEERQARQVPVTRGDLTEFIEDFVSPILATYHHKATEAESRITALEQRLVEQSGRILELEAALSGLVPHADR